MVWMGFGGEGKNRKDSVTTLASRQTFFSQSFPVPSPQTFVGRELGRTDTKTVAERLFTAPDYHENDA